MRTYETERLILKELDSSDGEMVLDYHRRNREFLQEWEPVRHEEFYTLTHQQKELDKDLVQSRNGSLLRLWIFNKLEEDRTIGTLAFNNIVRGAFLSCHLGYKLDQDEVGKGYMTEAVQKGIEIAFEEYSLHRIEANIMPKNKASLRVVEKLGFYPEGLARQQ